MYIFVYLLNKYVKWNKNFGHLGGKGGSEQIWKFPDLFFN